MCNKLQQSLKSQPNSAEKEIVNWIKNKMLKKGGGIIWRSLDKHKSVGFLSGMV